MPRLAATVALLIASVLPAAVLADPGPANQVSLRASVSQEVPYDLMHVTLYTEAQERDPAALAAVITSTLNQSLERARKVKGVSVKLGSRQSFPVYDDKGQRITAWRERAELRLESADFTALSSLTGELLSNLNMAEMSFSIASATRTAHEDALLKDAITAFKARAQLATEALGGKGYTLLSLNLNSNGQYAPRPMMNFAVKARAAMDEAITPDIEAGSTEVSVSADGAIEVLMP